MALSEALGYAFTGAAMTVVGGVVLLAGMQKPSPSDIIVGTVVDTRAVEGGDFKVLVSVKDRGGKEKRGYLTVSSGDIPTKGSSVQMIPSILGDTDYQLARLKYRVGPGIGIIVMGLISIAIGVLHWTE